MRFPSCGHLVVAGCVCLGFTAGRPVRADESQADHDTKLGGWFEEFVLEPPPLDDTIRHEWEAQRSGEGPNRRGAAVTTSASSALPSIAAARPAAYAAIPDADRPLLPPPSAGPRGSAVRGQLGPAYQAHHTWGPTLRIGSMVGTVSSEAASATGLGLSLAVGHRFGRFTVESELAALRLQDQGPSSAYLGRHSHLGVLARYDVLRMGSRLAGPNTMIAMYVEGGAAQTWNHWGSRAADPVTGATPVDTARVAGQAGFGIIIDHRLLQPAGLPDRVAWHLGWRFSAQSPEAQPYACRGECRLAPVNSQVGGGTATHESLEGLVIFQSSLAFSW